MANLIGILILCLLPLHFISFGREVRYAVRHHSEENKRKLTAESSEGVGGLSISEESYAGRLTECKKDT